MASAVTCRGWVTWRNGSPASSAGTGTRDSGPWSPGCSPRPGSPHPPTTRSSGAGWDTCRRGSRTTAGCRCSTSCARTATSTPCCPGMFEVDGLGVELARSSWDQETAAVGSPPAVPYALVALAAEGRVDRAVLLDGVLGRFLRGDQVAALRAFVVLHDELAPTEAELTTRVTRYVRLLPDAHSTVAALAHRALRRVDDTGRLELDTLLHGSGQLLARPEKMLVKAQLSWLDRVAKRESETGRRGAGDDRGRLRSRRPRRAGAGADHRAAARRTDRAAGTGPAGRAGRRTRR